MSIMSYSPSETVGFLPAKAEMGEMFFFFFFLLKLSYREERHSNEPFVCLLLLNSLKHFVALIPASFPVLEILFVSILLPYNLFLSHAPLFA